MSVSRFVTWKVRPSARIMAAAALAGGFATPALAQDTIADSAVALPAIVVSGSGYETEDTGSYATDLLSVGEKDVRSAREVPQSTTVLTNQYLEDRNATSLDTALRDAPGIVVLDNDSGRSSIFSRGFEFDTLYFNGLPAPLSSIYGTQPDMAIVDHVEILKGPSGLFAGAGEPAGAVNISLKKPLRDLRAEVSTSVNTWGGVRGEGDLTGPLNADGSLRGRLVVAKDKTEDWIDKKGGDTTVAYGAFEADITEMTTVTLNLSHMQRDLQPFNGLPTLADGTLLDLDRDTYTGADWNDFDNTVTDYIGAIEHRFEDGGYAKVSARYSDRSADFLYAYGGAAALPNGDISRVSWLARDFDETSLAVDAHASKPFTLFGQDHNILVGADYQHYENTMLQGRGNTGDTNNIFNWNTNLTRPTVAFTTQNEISSDQYGVYGQLRFKPIDPLTLIAGARGTWYKAETVNLLTGVQTGEQNIDGKITPYFGVVYDVTPEISAYASYTAIFQPQSNVDASGATLDPREGGQYEAGVKGAFLNGALNASAAVFKLNDKNRSMNDGNGNNVASEEVEVRGFELEASGEVLPGWDVMAGYTYTDTEYVNGPTEGAAFSAWTPEHMAQLWTKYRFPDAWNALYVGGGVKMFSEFSAVNGGTSIDADGYAVVDLMAGYDVTDTVTTTLTVNNAFDEKYYSRVGGTSVFNFYGEPLSAVLAVKATF